MKNRYVIFDGGKYDIIPSRITFLWYQTGLVHMLFPQWVATLDYSWNSRFPHDPNHLEYNSETPQVRKALNKEEWVESYYKGARPAQSGKKQSQIMQYLPWLAIGLVALVAFWSYNNMQAFAAHLNAIQNSLNAITK